MFIAVQYLGGSYCISSLLSYILYLEGSDSRSGRKSVVIVPHIILIKAHFAECSHNQKRNDYLLEHASVYCISLQTVLTGVTGRHVVPDLWITDI